MATKTTQPTLNGLFNVFFDGAVTSMRTLEIEYRVSGVCEQLFGTDDPENEEEIAKDYLRKSYPWRKLKAVYEYAIQGKQPQHLDETIEFLITAAGQILSIADTHNCETHAPWFSIIAAADGRFSLEAGLAIPAYKIALLANVDVRTVRNAISAGELIPYAERGEDTLIDNTSARTWLHSRKGFVPTAIATTEEIDLAAVTTQAEFAALLLQQKAKLEEYEKSTTNPALTPELFAALEAGVFTAPLSLVAPLATYYKLERKAFLQCVMRIFFSEELSLLTTAN